MVDGAAPRSGRAPAAGAVVLWLVADGAGEETSAAVHLRGPALSLEGRY